MEYGAIDMHHHFVPEHIIDEGKRHAKALGTAEKRLKISAS
jgi:hypothetical protein